MNSSIAKYTVKTILLILVLSFVVDKLVFYTFNHISDRVFTGQSIGKLNHYLQIKDEVDFVVYGSSRANHNVDPLEISESSFNMGKDGMKLAYSAALVKLLDNKKQQTVLLHIDPENAFAKDYDGSDIQSLTSKYNRSKVIKSEIDALGQNNILQNYYWSLGYNGKTLGIIKNYLKPNYNYKTYSGYDPIYVTENQRKIFKEILKKGKTEEVCQSDFVMNPVYAKYLNDLSVFCRDHNKTLILFTSPKYEDYCPDDNIQLSEEIKQMDLRYYDLTNYFNENNNLEFWKDKTHLSHKGAELFTKKISALIGSNN